METRIPWEIADLIVAQLNDSITAEQLETLRLWLNASEHHRALYEKCLQGEGLKNYYEQSQEHHYRPHFEDFRRYVARKKHRRIVRFGRYAAAIAAVFLLCFWGIDQLVQQRLGEYPDGQIVPGQYKALLTLSGGETRTLTAGEKELRLGEHNAFVREDTLIYEDHGNRENVPMHLLTIPRGGEYILKLSDGTRVWLNSESELSYPVRFRDSLRTVYLKGEAYFEVAHDSLHHFVVEAGEQRVTVLGTSFAIRAYAGEHIIRTTLEQGRVNVEAYGKRQSLAPGEQACLADGRLSIRKVNTSEYTAWHKGMFVFIDRPLEDILHTLARWYDIEVSYTLPTLKFIRFTGELQRYENIGEFLEKIEMLEKVRFQVKGKVVTVLKY